MESLEYRRWHGMASMLPEIERAVGEPREFIRQRAAEVRPVEQLVEPAPEALAARPGVALQGLAPAHRWQMSHLSSRFGSMWKRRA